MNRSYDDLYNAPNVDIKAYDLPNVKHIVFGWSAINILDISAGLQGLGLTLSGSNTTSMNMSRLTLAGNVTEFKRHNPGKSLASDRLEFADNTQLSHFVGGTRTSV